MNKSYRFSLTRNTRERHSAIAVWSGCPALLLLLVITLTGFFTQAQAFVIGHVEHQEAQATPNDSALSPDGNYLYTVADNSADKNAIVEVFSRDAQTGELTASSIVSGALADGITLASGGGIAISPDGLAAYVVGSVGDGSAFNFVDLAIFWFGRDIDTGVLTYLGHIKAGDTPANFGSTFTGPFIISNDGKDLYAGTIGGHASIEHYRIENDRSLIWDESLMDGINNEGFRGGHLRVYQDTDSKQVYATGHEHLGGMIYVFSRNAENGKLTIAQQISAKVDNLPDIEGPEGLTVSQDGKFVYVTTVRAKERSTFSEDEGVISIFDRDTASGALTYKNSVANKPVPHPSNGSDYNSLANDTDNEDTAVAIGGGGSLAPGFLLFIGLPFVYRRTRMRTISFWKKTSVLALLVFSYVSQASVLGYVEHKPIEDGVAYQTISPDGKHIYTVEIDNSEGHMINTYSRDANTGKVEFANGFKDTALSFSPAGVIVSPDNNDVYTLATYGDLSSSGPDQWGLSVMHFSRNTETGKLTYTDRLLSTVDFEGLSNPTGSMSFSPDGFYLYVGEVGAKARMVVFKRASNGMMSHVETIATDVNGDDFGAHLYVHVSQNGKNVYATSYDGFLYAFSRDEISGKLTALQTFGFEENPATESVFSADGKFIYVAASDYIHVFSRNTQTGELTLAKSVVADADTENSSDLWRPNAILLSTDTEQKFVYVSNAVGSPIVVYRRNAETGDLTWVGVEEDRTGVELGSISSLTISSDGYYLYAGLISVISPGITVFDTRSDISLIKTDSVDPAAPSGTLSYTLSATNNGPSDAQNVVVTDTLPAGMSYVSGSVNTPGASCTESEGTVTCNLGNLPITAATSAIIEATVPATTGMLTNTASVSADQLDTETANNTDSENTAVAIGGGSGGGSSAASGDGGNGDSSNASSSGGGGSLGTVLLIALGLSNLLRQKHQVKSSESFGDL